MTVYFYINSDIDKNFVTQRDGIIGIFSIYKCSAMYLFNNEGNNIMSLSEELMIR